MLTQLTTVKERVGVRTEWRLVYQSEIPGAGLRVFAAVANFSVLSAWFVEQSEGFWPVFDGAWFIAPGTVRHQIARKVQQQVLPQSMAHFCAAGLSHGRAILPEGIDRSSKAEPF